MSLIYVKEFINNEGGDDDYYKNKSVFIISFKDGEYIKEKIIRIVDSFNGQRFELPELQLIPAAIEQKKKDLEEARDVYNSTKAQLRDQLIAFDKITGDRDNSNELAQKTTSKIYIYLMFLAREKALYENLNKLNKSATSNQGYFWAPTRKIEEIKTKIGETKAEIEEF